MNIAQVAPLYESVPPQCYGGTERVVSYLTEELLRQGHDVTLFASGDSKTRAQLVPMRARALRLDPARPDPIPPHLTMFERVFAAADDFDVIHFHTDCLHLPLTRGLATPHVTTLHGRLDSPDLIPFYRLFSDTPVVSIGDHQRGPLSFVNWVGTVHHGLPENLYRYEPKSGDYLAFLGRVSPEKGLTRAIEIARLAKMPLRVAAKIDAADREYFETQVRSLFDSDGVEFLGEIDERGKQDFLGKARALLFPIDWPEPFGLVMIEAMACGTPVIAWRRGAVPEVVRHGETGFIVETVDVAVAAVGRVDEISRENCRRVFDDRFSASRMARDYVAVYQSLLPQRPVKHSVVSLHG